jgi:hypothetical protein
MLQVSPGLCSSVSVLFPRVRSTLHHVMCRGRASLQTQDQQSSSDESTWPDASMTMPQRQRALNQPNDSNIKPASDYGSDDDGLLFLRYS